MNTYTLRKNEYQKNRLDIINFLGGKCKRCGFSDYRALQIDHINGNGVSELKAISTNLYYKIIRENTTGDYQLLCANCNWIKRAEENENPNSKYRNKEYIKPNPMPRPLSTHCSKGHEKTPSSTYKHHGYLECLVCKKLNDKNTRKTLSNSLKILAKGKL